MPVSDKAYLLADNVTITTSADGTGKLVGAGPYNGMKVYLHVDSETGTTPTLDVKIQESDTLGSGYTDVPGGAFAQLTTFTTAQYAEIHIHWTKKYLRYSATTSGTSPSYVGVVIGLTPGQIPTS